MEEILTQTNYISVSSASGEKNEGGREEGGRGREREGGNE